MLRNIKVAAVIIALGMLVVLGTVAYSTGVNSAPDTVAGCYGCPFP